MLDIRELNLDFGKRPLFQDVNLTLLPSERYGVVGPNGAGKSTFLRILSGDETPSEGSVEKAKTTTLGILKQDHFHYEHNRVVDAVIRGKSALWSAMAKKEALLKKQALTEEEGYQLGHLEEIISHHDGYNAELEAEKLLLGLGIAAKYHHGPLSALSGGYKLRVLLAQVLFQHPDIMLLDEPTNHLDIHSIDWLEEFLKNEFKGLLVFVSHDRNFLNNLSTHILDIDYSTITEYHSNYDRFRVIKEETLQQKQREIQGKEKKIEALQTFVDRFGAKATKARQAASKLKMIGRIEDTMPDMKNSSVIKPYFNFTLRKPSGKLVLKVEDISKQYDERILLENVSFNLNRGEKYAVIGPNGIGKSTLLKILLNQTVPNKGRYEWNENAEIGYFEQDYRSHMPANQTILHWMENHVKATEQEIRKVLGQMLFRGNDADKKISVLSGGECARLVLASIILKKPNVLVLDEPTNHLDLESVDALTEALKRFAGSVLFVSHNRFFIDRTATRVLAITEKGMRNYLGNYQDYLAQYGKDYL